MCYDYAHDKEGDEGDKWFDKCDKEVDEKEDDSEERIVERSSCCLTDVHLPGRGQIYSWRQDKETSSPTRVNKKICSASARSMSKSILVPSI